MGRRGALQGKGGEGRRGDIYRAQGWGAGPPMGRDMGHNSAASSEVPAKPQDESWLQEVLAVSSGLKVAPQSHPDPVDGRSRGRGLFWGTGHRQAREGRQVQA